MMRLPTRWYRAAGASSSVGGMRAGLLPFLRVAVDRCYWTLERELEVRDAVRSTYAQMIPDMCERDMPFSFHELCEQGQVEAAWVCLEDDIANIADHRDLSAKLVTLLDEAERHHGKDRVKLMVERILSSDLVDKDLRPDIYGVDDGLDEPVPIDEDDDSVRDDSTEEDSSESVTNLDASSDDEDSSATGGNADTLTVAEAESLEMDSILEEYPDVETNAKEAVQEEEYFAGTRFDKSNVDFEITSPYPIDTTEYDQELYAERLEGLRDLKTMVDAGEVKVDGNNVEKFNELMSELHEAQTTGDWKKNPDQKLSELLLPIFARHGLVEGSNGNKKSDPPLSELADAESSNVEPELATERGNVLLQAFISSHDNPLPMNASQDDMVDSREWAYDLEEKEMAACLEEEGFLRPIPLSAEGREAEVFDTIATYLAERGHIDLSLRVMTEMYDMGHDPAHRAFAPLVDMCQTAGQKATAERLRLWYKSIYDREVDASDGLGTQKQVREEHATSPDVATKPEWRSIDSAAVEAGSAASVVENKDSAQQAQRNFAQEEAEEFEEMLDSDEELNEEIPSVVKYRVIVPDVIAINEAMQSALEKQHLHEGGKKNVPNGE